MRSARTHEGPGGIRRALVAAVALGAASLGAGTLFAATASVSTAGVAACTPDPDPPPYYAIELVTTRNIPGTGYARGTAGVTFRPNPFAVAVSADGSYTYDVHVRFEGLKAPTRGRYVAWVTTTEVDEIVRLGALDGGMRASGPVSWNKFLVVVTLEDADDPAATMWSGPIAFRGMSRSGRMHTMIGHGPLQDEKCAAYGYGN